MTAVWSIDERDIVIDMWKKGGSAAEIAKMIGRTRNSVLGYLFRLRKEFPDIPKKPNTGGRKARSPEERPIRRSRPKTIKVAKNPSESVQMINAFTPIVEQDAPEGGVPYFETRRLIHCSYILNTSKDAHKIKCCGATPFRGSSWCRKHWHEVFIERTRRERPDARLSSDKTQAASGFQFRRR